MAEKEDSLKLYWEYFFKAETGTYEKSTWLDLFLAEFLIRVNDGANPKELINFCPISGVVSLVGCELLCGIHRVTSSVNAHCATLPPPPPPPPLPPLPPTDADDNASPGAEAKALEATGCADPRLTSPSALTRATALSAGDVLRQYLVRTAWRCLLLLRALGVEGMSCCRQMSSVLVWVYGELREGGEPPFPALPAPTPSTSTAAPAPAPAPRPAAPRLPATPKPPIYELFSHKIWRKQKPSGAQLAKSTSIGATDRGSVAGRSRHPGQPRPESEGAPRRKAERVSSSDSGDTSSLRALRRPLLPRPAAADADHFLYYDTPRTPADSPPPLYTDPFSRHHPKHKPKPDDYTNDRHREMMNAEMSVYDLTLLVLELLQELCRTESSLCGAEGSQVSEHCANFALRNLCARQFGSSPPPHPPAPRRDAYLKLVLTELLVVSLDKVLVHPDLCSKLINNGVLPMLLRILEDVICKSNNRYFPKDEWGGGEELSAGEATDLLRYFFGVAYSIVAFFHCLLGQSRSVEKLRVFVDQFKLYGECLKGGLLKECVELMVRLPADEAEVTLLIKKLIESLGRLIGGTKRVRSEALHSAACARPRHKACRRRVAAGTHHHHDVTGRPGLAGAGGGGGGGEGAPCCISVLYGTLASLLTDERVSSRVALRSKLLKTMLSSGACCCFPPGLLMESVVRLVLARPAAAGAALRVLERAVYGELGAGVVDAPPAPAAAPPAAPCAVCEPRPAPRKRSHPAAGLDRHPTWSFLIHYNSLLQLDNHNDILHATVSHLLRVTPKCRAEMKYELLFSVIYPTFIVAKHRYILRSEEAAFFLTASCLNMFASLLNTVPFAEQFIQKGGLSYVLELVSLPEFSNQCCAILEIAIVVEIFKLMRETAEMTHIREIAALASVRMLFESLTDVTEKCFKIYRMKLPEERFAELADVTREREALGFRERRLESRKISIPQPMHCDFNAESTVEETVENYLEVLKSVWTFWRSCGALCLYSPAFRRFVAGERVFADSYGLLKLLLHVLCGGEECAQPELRILIKIVEALLTVHLAVSDVTSGRSKETSCGLVRGALTDAGAGRLAAGGGGGLRALCEALVRVCVARPSAHHAMPRAVTAKVPPLGCESGASSAGCSSSEDSSAGPYASEHSEPAPLDPGYEADVELGNLELLSLSSKSRKAGAGAAAGAGAGAGGHEDEGGGPVPCAEYSAHSQLAHPELCIVVVDVLTQLIHKLVSSPEGGAGGGGGGACDRATAGLARACCSRLAGALACTRAAPPGLLARLLSPHAVTLLTTADPQLQELQSSILELIHVVASQSISHSELCSLLRLFRAPRPPLGALLAALHRLVLAATPPTPDTILSFPTDMIHTDKPQSIPEEYVMVGGATSQSQQAERLAYSLHRAHTNAGLLSPWSVGAARCGLEGAGWGPWLQGFALLLWVRSAPPTPAPAPTPPPPPPRRAPTSPHKDAGDDDDDWYSADEWQSEMREDPKPSPKRDANTRAGELFHVVSVGTDSCVLELWLDTHTGSLTIRLTRPEPSAVRLVGSARVSAALPAHKWACLALNVSERMHKRKIHIQVTILVNGFEVETVSIPLQGVLVRKVTPTLVVVGHASRGVSAGAGVGGAAGGGAYHLSHVHVYRAPVLAVYTALHLAAHSPDHCCQVRCESPNYSLVLTPEVLDSNIDWEQVYDIPSGTLRELHENLLLTFAASSPHIMNLYHQTGSLPTVFAGRVASTASLAAGAVGGGAGGGGGGGGVSIPEALVVTWGGAARASSHRGVAPALYLLGGPPVLLYLFARVVELDGTGEEQATALAILLRVCRVDSRLYSALYAEPALHMLLTVLGAAKCRLTHHMLKVILDEACSSPLLTVSGGVLVLGARSDAAVTEPRLLLLLMLAWRQLHAQEVSWEVENGGGGGGRAAARGSLWALTLACVGVLLRDQHPRYHHNQHQLARVRLMLDLLAACKERYLNSPLGTDTHTGAGAGSRAEGAGGAEGAALVAAVRGLLGAPPHLHRIYELADFLLLLHQASNTFVTHSRANFYFLLSGAPPAAPPAPRRPRRARRARWPRSPSLSSDEAPPSPDPPTGEGGSQDNTKNMKGIINMHIKEGMSRTQKLSSTSDGSDVNMERSISIEQKAEDTQSAMSIDPKTDDTQSDKVDPMQIDTGQDEQKELEKGQSEQGESSKRQDEPMVAEGSGGGGAEGSGGEAMDDGYVVVTAGDVTRAAADDAGNTQQRGAEGAEGAQGTQAAEGAEGAGEGGWSAGEGLLLLLRDALAVLSDHHIAQAVSAAIQIEVLIVLGNHSSARVRAALVRVVAVIARRAPPDLAKKLRAHHYYMLLANQVSLYGASWELAAACAALLTACDVPLEDQLDADIWLDVGEECAVRSPPLLALLPVCLDDVPLVHNISLIVRKLIDKAPLKLLSEVCVAEVVVRAIRGAGLLPAGAEGRELLLEDLYELLNRIAIKAVSSPHSMATVVELHHLLSYVEHSARDAGAGMWGVVEAARGAQVSLFAAQLQHLEARLHACYSAHTKYNNYFTTVLSSAVSMGADANSRADRTELASRHVATVVRAVNFLVCESVHEDAAPLAPLVDRLLATLLPAVCGASSTPLRPKWWVGGGGGADWVSPLQELFCWAAAPAAGVRCLQPALLRALYLQPAAVPHLTATDPPAMRKLAVYLLSMLKHIHLAAETSGAGAAVGAGAGGVELAITDWARAWALGTQAGLSERVPSDTLPAEGARLLQHDLARWAKLARKLRQAADKAVFAKEVLASRLTEDAMQVTRLVVNMQNVERKRYMQQLQRQHADSVAAAQRWQRLIDTHTHEQGVWHCALGYPRSWELDATEGPGRVRVRLRRAHLHVPARHLQPAHRHKLDAIGVDPPLLRVVGRGGGGGGGGRRGGLVARLQLNETVGYMTAVTYVTVASETQGELLLSDRCIHFVPEDGEEGGAERKASAEARSWPLEAVVCVVTRRWCLQERAVELAVSSGHAHLIAFADQPQRDQFFRELDKYHLPNRTEPDTLNEAMSQWRNGQITNWEYLMRLNGLAGRTYNDLMQYPVLPFVLADYTSKSLDLHDPASFRDLTRPMAIQNKAREQHYINTYNDLKLARREGCSPLLRQQQPHHYPSLYSNSGGVLHYLVRLPPFTQLFLNYQDNNFDMPDRTFHSLATTWRLITNDSPTDVKELIPELFYLPELFHNNEGLNLGVRQCGAGVDSVELPAWAPDARLFTLAHRQALEAPYVSEHLPHWIDLVFGYKQTGQAAIDAINVFPACTYYGFDPLSLEDEVDRTAAAAMVRTYGQAPRQLLRNPHPHRAPDLQPAPPASTADQMSVWAGVVGARWGRYCGSPALGAVGVAARRVSPPRCSLQALGGARQVAVPGESTLVTLGAGGGGSGLAVVSWGHSDGVMRLKRRRDAPPDLLLHAPAIDQITKVSTSCITTGCPSPVFVGFASGRVLCLTLRQDVHAISLPLRAHTRPLIAHNAPVVDIHVCARARLLATASADGTIVLWDLNNLSYIRTLPNRDMLPVSLVSISATLCDVASVHAPRPAHLPAPPAPAAAPPAPAPPTPRDDDLADSYEKDNTYKYQSLVRVHTVNARFVGSVKVSELVTSICYSGAAEGVSVNCVACGLAGGGVRLYSSWDLRALRTIPPAHEHAPVPLTSLTYSSDSSVLFGCYADGLVVAWESSAGAGGGGGAGAGGKPAPIHILTNPKNVLYAA